MVINMNNKWLIPIIIVLVALFAVAVAYLDENPDAINNSGETMSFNVSSGPSDLSEVIKSIKTLPYFEGYDADTLKWMEDLGDQKVFMGDDCMVIMDSSNAGKIPEDPGITDVYIYNYFDAEVIENHDLGDELPTVYLVNNVKFINQEIIGNGLA